MFGLLRTTLALMVMVYHLFYHKLPLGAYSVFGFYIISGYLMTLIMHGSYSYTWPGKYSFAINRFLRLYPQYWAAAAISISLIYILGSDTVRSYNTSIFLPATISDYIKNILIAFVGWLPNRVTPRLVPPTWALTAELFFYALICLGISKTFARVKIWFLVSILYVMGSFFLGFTWSDRYYPIAAASLPFAVGSGIYFLSRNEILYSKYLRLGISSKFIFLLMLVNCFAFALIKSNALIKEVGGYINLVLCASLVYSVVKGGKIANISESLDKAIGDFSYPIYLLHWQTGLLVSYWLYGEALHGFSLRGFMTLIISLGVVFLLSLVFITVIDKPIQILRSRIKANKRLNRSPKLNSG